MHTLEHERVIEESAKRERERFMRREAESAAREAQLQMLRYQINPHFLFNTLNSINELVTLNERAKAQDMIQHLSRFLRHTLENENVSNVTLDQEIELLKLYLDIEQARFEERLNLEFNVDPLAHDALFPSLLLQPIYENAIKFAISASENGGTVRLVASVIGNQLQIEVSDTGPGVNVKPELEGHGVGLRNVQQRLETLYGSNYSFELGTARPNGLSVTIRIPFETASSEQPPMEIVL